MADPFEGWAIVELMGHRRLAGHVSEQQIAGAAFLRLDVHDGEGATATQFYSPSAVYCITPTSEPMARKIGAMSRPEPIVRWELEAADRRAAAAEDMWDHVGEDDGNE